MINFVWKDLATANKPTELALACYLISVSSLGMFLASKKFKRENTN
jgi:hypothetical protein